MIRGKLNFTILLFLISVLNLHSQTLPVDIAFFDPDYGTTTVVISESLGEVDDTELFQNAIATVNGTVDGGRVIVNAGTYKILEVDLKSNVHLEIAPNVIIQPFDALEGVNNTLFNADNNSGIDNFSIIGMGSRFTVDMSSLATDIRIRVISFKYCNNFKVSNFNIIDNYTEFSSLAFGSNYRTTDTVDGKRIDLIRGVPNHGIIEDISMVNGHYGYGLVQVQGGNNLLFRDLSITGGAALRLETGFDLLQYTSGTIFEAIKLDQIWARTIECTNGQSALQISPHTLDQGVFDASGITATSCEAAVIWAAGYATDVQGTNGLTAGSFDSESKIRDVTATFGQNAQMRSSRLRYIPCALRVARSEGVGVSSTLNIDGESYTAPSPGAVIREEDKVGHYALDFPDTEVTASGYNIEAHYLPPNAIFRSSDDDYETCNETVPSVSFWIPGAHKDTPNTRNPLENENLSTDQFQTKEVKIYPNPTNGILNFDIPNNTEIKNVRVINVLGEEVGNYQIENSKRIYLSHLTKGIYFLHIENGLSKKIVLF